MSEEARITSETEVAGSAGSLNNVVVKIGLVGDAQVRSYILYIGILVIDVTLGIYW